MTDLTAKLASGSKVEMTQLVMPGDGNILGTAFGGRIVQWIDLCAAMAAQRHCRMPVVTASIDRLDFLEPVRIADIALLRAQVNAVFGSSMEIGCAEIGFHEGGSPKVGEAERGVPETGSGKRRRAQPGSPELSPLEACPAEEGGAKVDL